MNKKDKVESLKRRLVIVTFCNAVISICIAVLFMTILEIHNVGKWSFFCKGMLLFVFLFLLSNIVLNSVTTSIILLPIRSLTREIEEMMSKEKDRGGADALNMSRYPELETLINAILKFVDTANKEKSMAMLIKNAIHSQSKTTRRDSLTSLFNREYLDQYLPDEMVRSRLIGYSLTVVMLDVDDFKHYNDTNGHPEGDVVLRKVADIIKNNTRDSDISIRYGGEEFLIIMPHTPIHLARKICERIRKTMEAEPFEHQEKQPGGNLTVSLGVASAPEHTANEQKLIKYADIALYHAKQSGKNQVVIYSEKLKDKVSVPEVS